MRRVDEIPPEVTGGRGTPAVTPAPNASGAAPPPFNSATAGAAGSTSSGGSVPRATAAASFEKLVGAASPVTLPPAPTTWKFREQTSAWADLAAERLRNAVASSNASLAAVLTRIVRGSLMHREVYRETAASPQLNMEALCIAGAIILAGFIGIWFTGFSLFYAGGSIGMFIRLALLRIVTWAAAAFAIQYAAKILHQVNLPVAAWFRALIYAQAPSLLMIVPAVGLLSGIWSAVCSVAAIHDLEGRDTISAIIIGVIGAVGATIATSIATAVLRFF